MTEICATVCSQDAHEEVRWKIRYDRTVDEDNPAIHYGIIASANRLMKDASHPRQASS